jgi:hypothetical protein
MKRLAVLVLALSSLAMGSIVAAPAALADSPIPGANDDYQISHAGPCGGTKDYTARLSLWKDSFGPVNFIFAVFQFDGIQNQNDCNGHPIANKVAIDWIRLSTGTYSNPTRLQICDQSNNSSSHDGGGCNYGDWSSDGSGPCYSFQDIQNHPQTGTYGACGYSGNGQTYTNSSLTGKQTDADGQQPYWAEAYFRIQWSDGTRTPSGGWYLAFVPVIHF